MTLSQSPIVSVPIPQSAEDPGERTLFEISTTRPITEVTASDLSQGGASALVGDTDHRWEWRLWRDFDFHWYRRWPISLASADDDIRGWSYGEELRSLETINCTLSQKGTVFFCEKIFGPVRDWECACGKYKGIR